MIRHVDRANARLFRLLNALEAAGGDSAMEAAKRARISAMAQVPVRTGRLRGSLDAEKMDGGARLSAKCDYAAAVELGSSKASPRPFLSPAAHAQRSFFAGDAARRAKAALKSEGGRK